MRLSVVVAALLLTNGCGRSVLEDEPNAPSIACGLGTHLEGGQCFADSKGIVCGSGTLEQGGVCVPQLQCGPGTSQQGTRCVPSGSVSCGPGTSEQSGVCVPDLGCGPGTAQAGSFCVPSAPLTCGVGTTLNGTECVAQTQVTCAPGTTLVGSVCVANQGWYEVRVAGDSVFTDGLSVLPVVALGRLPTGAPALESVRLTVEPATAGTLLSQTLTLGALGSITDFVPCSSTNNTSCLGTARIRMALAASPGQVVAESQPFALVAPPALGVPSSCDSFPNALAIEGTSYIFSGRRFMTDQALYSWISSGQDALSLYISPGDGTGFKFEIASPQGTGPLAETTYAMTVRIPVFNPGSPGFNFTSVGRGCNQASGTFQVHRLVVSNGQLSSFLATFENFCENLPTQVVRGCIKFTR